MRSRRLGKTNREVSEIGFGAWAIGGSWGETDDRESLAAMGAAVDAGVTFFDTADVYGDGRSERLVAALLRERSEELVEAPPDVGSAVCVAACSAGTTAGRSWRRPSP